MSAFLKKILLATDGSEDAVLATGAAVEITKRAGSELHLVHAWQEPPQRGYATPTEAYLSKLYAERAWELLEDQAERIKKSGVEIAGAHRRLGSPADEIVKLAGELDVDLVLLGSRGLGAVKRLVLGPSRRSPCCSRRRVTRKVPFSPSAAAGSARLVGRYWVVSRPRCSGWPGDPCSYARREMTQPCERWMLAAVTPPRAQALLRDFGGGG